MTWAAPLAFGWLALMALIGLFYLLRPKRQRLAVASLLLWHRTLQRERDESWLDWLKRHLLLILQLLVVAALALALARPECTSTRAVGPPVAVVVDASMSMQIDDVGRPRIEAAKDQAIGFVRELPADVRVSVLSAGGAPRPLVTQSANRFEIEAAIDGIRPTAAEGAIPATLDIALSLAPPAAGGMVALFSDGAFELPPGRAYADVTAFIVAGDAANVALEQFAVRREFAEARGVQGLVVVRNDGTRAADVAVRIEAAGIGVAERQLTIAPRARETLLIDDLGAAPGYSATVVHDGDGLALDNTAFAELSDPRNLRVLVVGEETEPIVRALQATARVTAAAGTPAEFDTERPHDIYVFQGWLPEILPNTSVVLVGPPDIEALGVQELPALESAPRAARDSALLRHVDPLDMALPQTRRYRAPPELAVDLDVDGGAVLAHGVVQRKRLVLIGLDLLAPSATIAPWYPVFWSNVLQWSDPFNPRGDDLPLTPDRPAQLIAHPQADELAVVHPSGARSDFPVTAPAMLDVREIGTYVVRQYREGEVLAQTRLVVEPPEGEVGAGFAQTMTGAASPAAGATAGVPESFELWPILAALALFFLIAEWWWFHRVRGLR